MDMNGRLRPLEDIIEETVRHALYCSDENVSTAAKLLGVARSTLYKKIK
jgi:transcriptional regulator of acetoin/glycerol metabolism